MRFPELKKLRTTVDIRNTFGGYDHTENVSDGEFYDCENISSDAFPLISVRKPRAVWNAVQKNGLGEIVSIDSAKFFFREGVSAAANVNDKLVLCASRDIIYDGESLDVELAYNTENRMIIPFGRNFFVSPDSKYCIPEDDGTVTVKHVSYLFKAGGGAYVDCCFEDGSFPQCGIWHGVPHIPNNGDIMATVTQSGVFASVYDAASDEWTLTDRRICSRIAYSGINDNIEVGDTVYLSGFSESALNGKFKVTKTAENKIIVATPEVFSYSEEHEVTVEKRNVILDCAVEHNNRIWGCRYGKNEDGVFVNEIYASALGDPTAWRKYDGISTDSYCVSLGCSGKFTGVCVLGGDVVFFKEDHVIRISGDSPSDFTVNVTPILGVENGALRSVVNINDRIFYKSRLGITVFDGVSAYCISDELGEMHFSDMCAGTVEGKYYFAATDSTGVRKIYIYDTYRRLWYKEDDNGNVQFFVYIKNCLYFICRLAGFNVSIVPGFVYCFMIHNSELSPEACNIFTDSEEQSSEFSYTEEKELKWFAETGMLGTQGPQSLILRKLNISLRLPEGSLFAVDIMCDSDKEWRRAFYSDREFSGAFTVPVNMPRCSNFKLKFSGEGSCVIDSVTRIYEKTGGVNMLGR